MLFAGFELAERILSFSTPVLIGCTGHAVAMGVFLLLSADYRVGVSGPYRITANEVAIGLTMPRAAVEICRQRLTPAHFNRAVVLAEVYAPVDAADAGFLDRVVAPSDLGDVARTSAVALAGLDLAAHAATKQRARRQALTLVRAAIEADAVDLRHGAA
jgi:enoyl-CoA hydratase